jgi:three-Cys-motif partner protein
MAAPKEVVWRLDPHTRAKHEILRHYLQAWFPIIAKSRSSRVVYYDGFAGPGRYRGGEPGSPIIAIDVAKDHRGALPREIVFIFVEEDSGRADHLRGELERLEVPDSFRWHVENQDFRIALQNTLDDLEQERRRIAPTFAFVDPFGISIPFQLIARLLKNPSCEVMITFMADALHRFPGVIPDRINDLVGTADAAVRLTSVPPRDRIVLARRLYEENLRRVARYVRFFTMRNRKNREIYDLFFASNHPKGHEKVKEAMWRADRSGGYSFSDGVDPDQQTLFTAEPQRELATILWRHYRGRVAFSEEVLRYVIDETAYLESHARDALRVLETGAGAVGERIEVEALKADGRKRRASTYPPGTRIRFVDR